VGAGGILRRLPDHLAATVAHRGPKRRIRPRPLRRTVPHGQREGRRIGRSEGHARGIAPMRKKRAPPPPPWEGVEGGLRRPGRSCAKRERADGVVGRYPANAGAAGSSAPSSTVSVSSQAVRRVESIESVRRGRCATPTAVSSACLQLRSGGTLSRRISGVHGVASLPPTRELRKSGQVGTYSPLASHLQVR
jgi:hypothetical protein